MSRSRCRSAGWMAREAPFGEQVATLTYLRCSPNAEAFLDAEVGPKTPRVLQSANNTGIFSTMSFEPDPRQTLYMLRLTFGPPEPRLQDLQPPLEPVSLRKQLEAQGLIRLEKRGRQQHVLLTDKGWQWTQRHLSARIDVAGVVPGLVLKDLLPRLQSFLEREGYALADLFANPGASAQDSSQQIRTVLLELGRGRAQQRLTLAQVRSALPQLTREVLDTALLDLQRSAVVALYHEDNPALRTAEVEAAALQLAASRYHLVYLLK